MGESNEDGENDIKAVIKENFIDDPKHDLYNILVGEFVRYDLEVTGTGDAKEFDYKFDPNSAANGRHERLGKDYEAWLLNEANYKAYKDPKTAAPKRNKIMLEAKVKEAGMPILPNTKYVLLVRPLVAGTFQLNPICTKKKKGMETASAANIQINFNCAKIEGWWVDHQDEGKGLFKHSKNHNNFYFQINDGDESTDKYLTQKENRGITFTVDYNGQNYPGKFIEGRPVLFYSDEPREGAAPNVDNRTITSVTLRISELGHTPIRITYYNISMNQRSSE